MIYLFAGLRVVHQHWPDLFAVVYADRLRPAAVEVGDQGIEAALQQCTAAATRQDKQTVSGIT